MSTNVKPAADRLPPQTKFIVGNEACERFSFYGMRAILTNYCLFMLMMSEAEAKEVGHLFNMAVYFLPVLGGWIADRWWGRYRTILYISLVYCVGNAMLAFSVGSRFGLFAGILLIAVGAGGIKPCVSAFVGDQFGSNQQHLLTKVYGLFYWSINFGSFFAFGFIPSIRDNYGYRWAFGVPGITMALATLIFWLGRKRYVMKPPTRGQQRAGFFRVFLAAWAGRTKRKPGQSFLDGALGVFSPLEVQGAKAVAGILLIFAPIPIFWSLFDQQFTTWVLQGNRMKTETYLEFQSRKEVKPWFTPQDFRQPPALAAKLQQTDNPLASHLRGQLSPETRALLAQPDAGGKLSAGLTADLNRILTGPSLYDTNLFKGLKLTDRCKALVGNTPDTNGLVRLNRLLLEEAYPQDLVRRYAGNQGLAVVFIKLLFSELSPNQYALRLDAERMLSLNPLLVMMLIPLFTAYFYPLWGRWGFRATPLRRMSAGMVLGAVSFVVCGWLQWRLQQGEQLSILWQIAPYVIITAGEVMLSATGLEFAFSQAPKSMKSTIMSFWLLTNAVGNLLVVFVTMLNDKVVKAKGATEFYFYAVLMFFVSAIFIYLAMRYKERTVVEPDQPQQA
jgi:dipeptide/tripeptide permease